VIQLERRSGADRDTISFEESRKSIHWIVTIFVRPGLWVVENSQERMAKKKALMVRSAVAAGRVSRSSRVSIPVEECMHQSSLGVIAFCRFVGGSTLL
jgi:hypothetical protein